MSRQLGWIPRPGVSYGTASWASSERDAQSFSLHTGEHSLSLSIDSVWWIQTSPAQMFWTRHRESGATRLSVKANVHRQYPNYNWFEFHCSWNDIVSCVAVAICCQKHICCLESFHEAWGHIDWLVPFFFFFHHEKRNCQYRWWSLFIIQDFLEQS